MAQYTLVIGNKAYSSWSLSAMQEWYRAANAETEVLPQYEHLA